jgi:hypothetical protein
MGGFQTLEETWQEAWRTHRKRQTQEENGAAAPGIKRVYRSKSAGEKQDTEETFLTLELGEWKAPSGKTLEDFVLVLEDFADRLNGSDAVLERALSLDQGFQRDMTNILLKRDEHLISGIGIRMTDGDASHYLAVAGIETVPPEERAGCNSDFSESERTDVQWRFIVLQDPGALRPFSAFGVPWEWTKKSLHEWDKCLEKRPQCETRGTGIICVPLAYIANQSVWKEVDGLSFIESIEYV